MNEWLEVGCRCTAPCTCRADCELKLPGPVVSVVEVRVGGQEIPPAAYTLQGDHLIRTDGHCWPDCQDLGRPDTEPDTWSVTYRRGREVPPCGRAAAAVLADEILKACTGASGCRLPQRVKELTREGVSMTMMDDMEFLADGRTGIGEVDQWLAAVNPKGLRSRPQVWTPDGPQHRTR